MEIKLQVELEEKRKKALNLQKVSRRGMILEFVITFIYLVWGGGTRTCAPWPVLGSEHNFLDTVLSFHHVGPKDQTQAVRLGSKGLSDLSFWPSYSFKGFLKVYLFVLYVCG